jgi:hypothetical protein
VGAAEQFPLRLAGSQPSAHEPLGALHGLEPSEDRLNGLAAQPIARLALGAIQPGPHRCPQPVTLGLRRSTVLVGLAVAGVAGVVAGWVAADQFRAGRSVVADAVNSVEEARDGWATMAGGRQGR